MPCCDGREQESAAKASRDRDAMAALLCGVMRANRVARDLAETWYFWHAGLDDLRKTDPYGKDANMARGQISQVLDRAYIALCKGGLS